MKSTILSFNAFLVICSFVLKVVQCDIIGPRIIGGSPIAISDAPYTVSVRLKDAESQRFGLGHLCGGSVITSRVVLTAAHCIASSLETPIKYYRPNEFTLVMGDTFLLQKQATNLQFDVQEIVVHPSFDKPTALENDIALMFFRGYVVPNQFIRLIALNTVVLAENTLCKVSGWGKINSEQISNNLMQAVVPIVEQRVCEFTYGSLPRSEFCAGYMTAGGVDACQGDSGGPLVCEDKLAGIVSWGKGCAQRGFPGIYTNVSHFVGWIEKTNATFNYSSYAGGAAMIKTSLMIIILVLITNFLK